MREISHLVCGQNGRWWEGGGGGIVGVVVVEEEARGGVESQNGECSLPCRHSGSVLAMRMDGNVGGVVDGNGGLGGGGKDCAVGVDKGNAVDRSQLLSTFSIGCEEGLDTRPRSPSNEVGGLAACEGGDEGHCACTCVVEFIHRDTAVGVEAADCYVDWFCDGGALNKENSDEEKGREGHLGLRQCDAIKRCGLV